MNLLDLDNQYVPPKKFGYKKYLSKDNSDLLNNDEQEILTDGFLHSCVDCGGEVEKGVAQCDSCRREI